MAYIKTAPMRDTETCLREMSSDAAYEVAGDADALDGAESAISGGFQARRAGKTPKLYLSGKCINNCAYCGCRCSREDKAGYCLLPRELAELAFDEAVRSGCGVFLSSAVYKSENETQELLAETVRILRRELGYGGYIHCKVMPGADPELIERTGENCDRMSVNIEVADSSGYELIARDKSREKILAPMGEISKRIRAAREERRRFAVSETTQLMAGAVGEDDGSILALADALYKKYDLGRVYYTAYSYRQRAEGYEELELRQTPEWRKIRLYQADRLIKLYGFSPKELLPGGEVKYGISGEINAPSGGMDKAGGGAFLDFDLDPKTAWALRNPELFPIEVNSADPELLIRIPGIGIQSARRITEARRYAPLTHEALRMMRIPHRSVYFITCRGVYRGGSMLGSSRLRGLLGTGIGGMRDSGGAEQLRLPI